jgi:hypothetical protein
VGRVGAKKPRRRVVLLASLDAGQASPLCSGRLRSWLSDEGSDGTPRGASRLPMLGLAAAAVVALASALGADGAPASVARFTLAGVLAVVSWLGLRWARDTSSAGANDDASGVAAMLTAVEQLAAQLPPDVELWCAATGAGQSRGQGVRALLDAHPEWKGDHTAFVAFDTVGAGALHWARSDGDLARAVHAPLLGELARRIAASGAYGDVSPFDLAFETTGHPVARRGAQVLSLVGLQPDRLPLHWRERDDSPQSLDTETVIRAADFGCCVLSAYLRGDAEPLAYV